MARRPVTIRIRGLTEAARNIEALAKAGGEAVVSGMRVIGEEIMTDVQASRSGAGVPKDEGTLSRSGRVSGPDAKGTVLLSFGGAAAPYALRQHEELQYRHTVGEPRYLVRGVQRWAKGFRPIQALQQMAKEALAKVAARKVK